MSKRIMAISGAAGKESEDKYADTPHGAEVVCYAVAPAEGPIRDAMSGRILDRDLATAARQKEFKHSLADEAWPKRTRDDAYRATGERPV